MEMVFFFFVFAAPLFLMTSAAIMATIEAAQGRRDFGRYVAAALCISLAYTAWEWFQFGSNIL